VRGVGASSFRAISASGGNQDGGHDSWNIASYEYPFLVVFCLGRLLLLVACSRNELPLLFLAVAMSCARAACRPRPPFPPQVFDTKGLSC